MLHGARPLGESAQRRTGAVRWRNLSLRTCADCFLLCLPPPLPCACFSLPTELHVYDKDKNYVPFDAEQPETFFEVQRKVIPNSYNSA